MAILRLGGRRETLAVLVPYHRVLARSTVAPAGPRGGAGIAGDPSASPAGVLPAPTFGMKPYHKDACTAGAAHANFLNTNFPKLCVQKPSRGRAGGAVRPF